MQVSKRFLALLDQQLAQFTDRPDLLALVVYLALPGENGKPSLVPIGQWPRQPALPAPPTPGASGGSTVSPDAGVELGEARRWLALRDDRLLLGALRVDADRWPWPRDLGDRLDATARCLTEALRLDLEQQRLGRELDRRDEQLRLLVHQLRNPLAALRTFGQLLLRRLEGDPGNRTLVDQLLGEQRQLNRYVDAIDLLAAPAVEPAPAPGALIAAAPEGTRLLLPAGLAGEAPASLQAILTPLLERASATASLQGRPWHGPAALPSWRGDGGAVGEIVANLLENAFRYSPAGSAVGLHCSASGSRAPEGAQAPLSLTVWDGGPAIPVLEREAIFQRGVRGSTGQGLSGSGLGLALARDLARGLGGELSLVVPPAAVDPALPSEGNAFQLSLPGP
ncbi:sensor histidine kinase [Vulcanococcus limneticus]|uniref:sensor histidine kinase n=1 Tax=Vulcanococcus limneticus TaxID=2170428 RepID=UPI00398BFA56